MSGLWELAVLAFLRERPMHPYEIQRLLKERHKDEVLVLKRGSLYHAIERLVDAGLIVEMETTRDGFRPERTTYRITPAGRTELTAWLRKLIAVPRRERSEFTASVSFLVHLTPEDAIAGLKQRIEALESEIAETDRRLAEARTRVDRIHLIETEYARAMRAAELGWTRALVKDLRNGRLTWDLEAILASLGPAAARRKRTKAARV